ncbi:MAG: hypothetical protein ACLF0G_08415 [Candidatus Brocadiia bacterium]
MGVDEKLAQAVRRRAREGRLACAAAFAIAEELGLRRIEVGRAADALGVKIVDCQLGCFGRGKAAKAPGGQAANEGPP